MPPTRIAAGETHSISTAHRHGFYIWDAEEGEEAPLYRGDASSKRWVKRVSANYFQHGTHLDVVIDASFQVFVVNMGHEDRELIAYFGRASQSFVVQAGGGSVKLTMLDGQSIEINGGDGDSKTVVLRRSDGDPQLLPLHPEDNSVSNPDSETENFSNPRVHIEL